QEVAVLARGLAGGHQTVAQAQVAAQLHGSRLGVEEAVGTDLDLEAALALGPDGAAGPAARFENGDVGVGQRLLKPVGDGEAGDAGTEDEDAGHGRSGNGEKLLPAGDLVEMVPEP